MFMRFVKHAWLMLALTVGASAMPSPVRAQSFLQPYYIFGSLICFGECYGPLCCRVVLVPKPPLQ